MKNSILVCVFLYGCLINFTANAQSSYPVEEDSKTKVLVLATPHLSQIQEDFSPTLLDSLINVLENYSPSIIGIEALSGSQIAEMERRGNIYNEVLKNFASSQLKFGQNVQKSKDVTWQKANAMADSLLGEIQQARQASDKIRLSLINNLIASYRLHTAALQWSYISPEYKEKQSVVNKNLTNALGDILNSANENASISLRLAHKLNIQRIYPIDDHLEKDYYLQIITQMKKAMDDSTIESFRNAPHFKKYQSMIKEGLNQNSLFAVYRYMNSPTYLEQDKNTQWRNPFLESSQMVLRKRLALWEVRNLNISAHIRKASAHDPGGNVLVTIGASHKPFLDTYLKEMLGVELLNLSDIDTGPHVK